MATGVSSSCASAGSRKQQQVGSGQQTPSEQSLKQSHDGSPFLGWWLHFSSPTGVGSQGGYSHRPPSRCPSGNFALRDRPVSPPRAAPAVRSWATVVRTREARRARGGTAPVGGPPT